MASSDNQSKFKSGGPGLPAVLGRLASDYGMVFVLAALCLYYSWATISDQRPTGEAAARRLGVEIGPVLAPGTRLLVVGREAAEDGLFAKALVSRYGAVATNVLTVLGQPADARAVLDDLLARKLRLDLVACAPGTESWSLWEQLDARYAGLGKPRVMSPGIYRWPNFLKAENLLNVANQIAVIAILAIGMTMVIVSGGIDLSVGSLIALSAVLATRWIVDYGGAEHAGTGAMLAACGLAMLVCALVGLASGFLVTVCQIPPFIATLAMMLVGSGLAFLLSKGQSIYRLPDTFTWIGRGMAFGVPNGVWLMGILYALAQGAMARTVAGRYLYAVGGNAEAARLSGVPVKATVTAAYVVCGGLAGLGGVVLASQLKSGAPTYGMMYELYVIAAVVVGGTSLNGGRGKILGTLIGAFIIAVIQNGMNLTNVESYTQKVVLGLVILGAVLLDRFKQRGWQWLARMRRGR